MNTISRGHTLGIAMGIVTMLFVTLPMVNGATQTEDIEASILNIWGSDHPIILFGQNSALGDVVIADLDSSPDSEPLPTYTVCIGPRNTDKSVVSRFKISDKKVKIIADITGGTGPYAGSEGYIKIINPNWKITEILDEGSFSNDSYGTGVIFDIENGTITWSGRLGYGAPACHENGLRMEFIVEEVQSSIGYSATVASGQNTFIQSSNGAFGTILTGTSKVLNSSVILNNTGDLSASVDARFADDIGGIFGLISGANVLAASNFELRKDTASTWTALNNSGANVYVTSAPPLGALTALDARLTVPEGQPGGAYSGTVVLTFGNEVP